MTPFDSLSPTMQRWVWLQGWHDLRDIQKNSIPAVIGADRDVIISAPTAGGKTEAAYLPIISNLLGGPVGEGYGVLNVSPLKALINDQNDRLAAMNRDTGIRVTPWHGDIASSVKLHSLDNPQGILLITPESLESMFVNRADKLVRAFSNLRYVVVDELHAFMEGERGIQLQSLLARIEALIGREVPRIALSATFSDYSAAAEFLRPGRGDYPYEIPSPGKERHDTLVLIKEFIPKRRGADDADELSISEAEHDYTEFVSRDIYRNLRGSNNLVFANSRKEVETLALKLRDHSESQGVPDEFVVHHGSLSREERHNAEERLKSGLFPATAICTSTLELGVDIGKVKSIAQLVAANSVSSLRQRLGRSGRRGEPSVLRIYSCDEPRDDYKFLLRTNLVQNIAVIELLSQSKYERPNLDIPHYSTLIQQILSVTAQYGGFYPKEGWNLLCRNGAFRNIPPNEYLDILTALGEKGYISQTSSGQIVIGKTGERIIKNLDFYTSFVTNTDFNVLDKTTGNIVGSIQYLPYVGEYILLSARRWIVEAIDDRASIVQVNPATSDGKLMFEGFGQEIDALITRRMRDIYEGKHGYPYLDRNTGADAELRNAREAYRSLGLDRNNSLTFGEEKLIFTWGGMKMNRTLALMHKAKGYSMPVFDPYAVANVTDKDLKDLLSNPPDTTELAKLVSRQRKQTEKYDYLLPDHLLDKKYAASHLWNPNHHI